MIRAKIDEKLERRFRELAMKRFGYGKGALTKAVEDAILKWISTIGEETVSFEGDPIKILDGILSGIDVDAVSLQHKIMALWLSKVSTNVSD
ncbi:MAG: hypothetical protein QXF28_07900 [Nitrososphaerota archaeon]